MHPASWKANHPSPPYTKKKKIRISEMGQMAVNWEKTALLVIAMQKDYVLASSRVALKAAPAIVPNVVKAVELARHRGMLVVWVVREHDPAGRDVELSRSHRYSAGRAGPVIKGSVGAELIDELEIREEDYKLVKTWFSAFFNTNLHSVLQRSGITSLVFVGIQTPNCIRQTVFDAVALDYPCVTVITDATAATTTEIHDANILDMKNVKVATPTMEEWISKEEEP